MTDFSLSIRLTKSMKAFTYPLCDVEYEMLVLIHFSDVEYIFPLTNILM